jgi:hypothetical protein
MEKATKMEISFLVGRKLRRETKSEKIATRKESFLREVEFVFDVFARHHDRGLAF